MFKFFKKHEILSIIILVLIIFVIWACLVNFGKNKKIEFGANFSQKYCQDLGLDAHKVLLSLLDDLKIKKFRLSAYWDTVEKNKDKYDFSEIDWQVAQIQKRAGDIILSIGHRLPRWPECQWPDWAHNLSNEQWQKKVLELLEKTIAHYKDNPSIIAWQVENEPFLKIFGKCPIPDNDFFKKEIALVRSLDSTRPIIITESGELSTWYHGAKLADIVGTSVYRTTWNKWVGYFHYLLPPSYYYLKTQLIKLITPVKDVIITEMQMEPWVPNGMKNASLEEQYKSMDLKEFENNLNYVAKTGLSPIYLWGPEWWFYLKEKGDGSIWDAAKKIWNN